MARAILKFVDLARLFRYLAGAFVGTMLLLMAPVSAAAAVIRCDGADHEARNAGLLHNALRSPLFDMLRKRLGPPIGCRDEITGDTREVVLMFRQGGSLTLSVSDVIETSAQEAILPHPAITLTRPDAVRILRAVERSDTQPSGCGIAWSELSRTDGVKTKDVTADGAVCNCRAHLRTDHGAVTALGFSLAC